MPVEGENAGMTRAGDVAREDAPTCRLDEKLEEVKSRIESEGWDTCVVVNDRRVVLGLLRPKQLEGDPARTAEQAMAPGPSTFRPHVDAADLGEYMTKHDLASAPITTGDGVLVGVLLREDAAKLALERHQHGHDR